MRILWISMNDGLLRHSDASGYNGIGWIASLQALVEQSGHQLALAFLSENLSEPTKKNGTIYFPVYRKPKNKLSKLLSYYFHPVKSEREQFLSDLNNIIESFKPDVIHLFGTENPLATIIGRTPVPVFVHLQGMMLPCSNAALPPGFSRWSFLLPFSVREWILRNGYLFNLKQLNATSIQEWKLLADARLFLGRTTWDYEISRLLSPDSKYFHVNEILRGAFYENAGQWKWKPGRNTIISVISPVSYKGLDLILKTADILEKVSDIRFEWMVVGISPKSHIISVCKRKTEARCNNVTYAGVLDEMQLKDALLSSAVYVHPSYIDNSSNSICEAQMLGLPVIATNVGGTSTLINDEVNGLLVPANDPFQLAYRIKLLAKDGDLAAKLSAKAIQDAGVRHNRNDVISSLFNAYSSVLK